MNRYTILESQYRLSTNRDVVQIDADKVRRERGGGEQAKRQTLSCREGERKICSE